MNEKLQIHNLHGFAFVLFRGKHICLLNYEGGGWGKTGKWRNEVKEHKTILSLELLKQEHFHGSTLIHDESNVLNYPQHSCGSEEKLRYTLTLLSTKLMVFYRFK